MCIWVFGCVGVWGVRGACVQALSAARNVLEGSVASNCGFAGDTAVHHRGCAGDWCSRTVVLLLLAVGCHIYACV